MIDWSATAAWIALIVAIVSPVVTTIINLRHQSKTQERDLMAQRKLEAIDGYLKSVSLAAYTLGVPDDFSEYRALILLYAPKDLSDKIKALNRAVESTQFSEETAALLYEVAEALKAENKVG